MTKKETREMIRSLFREKTLAERALCSERICNQLSSDKTLDQAEYILAYYPLKDEVDIRPLLAQLHQEGKTVVLPEVTGDTTMRLRIYNNDAETTAGALGTRVPMGDIFTEYERIDVALIPGMAFDRHGHRLGRGKGYYDRFLTPLSIKHTIGVCFPWQIIDNVPFEEHDKVLTRIVSLI